MKTGIVLTTFNRPQILEDTLTSLNNSDLSRLDKLIIIDDQSEDEETIKIIKAFKFTSDKSKHVNIEKIYKNENMGMFDSLKMGFSLLKKEGFDIIGNIDADIEFKSNWLNKCIELLTIHPNCYISPYNTLSHTIGYMASDYAIKEHTGGICLLFTKENSKYIIDSFDKQYYWDWELGKILKENNRHYIVTVPSLIQHTGTEESSIKGKNSENPSMAEDFGTSEVSNMDVIIISNTKNDELLQVTNNAIKTLVESSKYVNFNVIVVESNRARKTTDYFKVDNLLLLDLSLFKEGKFNYNKAINTALYYAKNEYIAICNNDLVFNRNWADIIITQMKAKKAMVASPFSTQAIAMNNEHKDSDYNIFEGNRTSIDFAGWCFVIKQELIPQIGKFDESVLFWYSDDIFLRQIEKLGYKNILVKDSVVEHIGNGSETLKQSKEIAEELTSGQKESYEKAKENLENNINFFHSGNIGDVICSLPTVRELCRINDDKKAVIYLNVNAEEQAKVGAYMPIERANWLKPLLMAQSYIRNVILLYSQDDAKGIKFNYNLDLFRIAHASGQKNLVYAHLKAFNLSYELAHSRWIELPPSNSTNYGLTRGAYYVVNRTMRYRADGGHPDYSSIIPNNELCFFVGYRDEFADFINTNQMQNIQFLSVDNALELAILINNSKMFAGNGSSAACIAEGLKHNLYQEINIHAPSLVFTRSGAAYNILPNAFTNSFMNV